jgi:hypothetical protein
MSYSILMSNSEDIFDGKLFDLGIFDGIRWTPVFLETPLEREDIEPVRIVRISKHSIKVSVEKESAKLTEPFEDKWYQWEIA